MPAPETKQLADQIERMLSVEHSGFIERSATATGSEMITLTLADTGVAYNIVITKARRR